MAQLQAIVERLNAEPFRKGLTLVTFDEVSGSALVQLLNDVLVDLDPSNRVDVRDEPDEETGARMARFLGVLKYPLPAPGPELESFQASLAAGDRRTIYPVLHYLLQKRDLLKKRAYVARFLSKVEIPPEFLHEEATQELLSQLHALQLRFREVHMEVDKLRAKDTKPAELRRDVRQIEEEQRQLVDKIATLKSRTEDLEGFKPLLEATSELRKEQEEEAKLSERLMEQRQALGAAEKRYSEVARRLAEARSTAKEDLSGEEVLALARREEAENRRLLSDALPRSLRARRETLEQLHEKLSAPVRSEADVAAMEREVRSLENNVRRLTESIAEAQRAAGDDRLGLYRQQSALIARKRVEEEEAVMSLKEELEALGRAVEGKEAKLSELSGPRFMRREDFRTYREGLIRKTREYKAARAQLAEMRQETVVLADTERLLKSRAGDVDEVLARLEERRGVTGYLGVQENLERVSALKAAVDETKGRTLTEISQVVSDINMALKDRRAKLTPQVKELRQLRLDFAELEGEYKRARRKWDETKAGLDSKRGATERLCDTLQNECIELERTVHLAAARLETTRERIARAADEERFQAGEASLLRDFRSWKDLYASKLAQQETLARELRKRRKELNETASFRAEQKSAFRALQRILELKRDLYEEGKAGPGADARREEEAAAGVDHTEIGGANVMTLG